jgi:hypothetical protein
MGAARSQLGFLLVLAAVGAVNALSGFDDGQQVLAASGRFSASVVEDRQFDEAAATATDESMAAFLLSACTDSATAEYFMRVLAPPSSDETALVTPAITPSGYDREHVFSAASRLLTFGYCSEVDAPLPKNEDEEDLAPEQMELMIDRLSGPQGGAGGAGGNGAGGAANNADPVDWASARVAIAQKLIQRDLLRQAFQGAGGGNSEPISNYQEVRALDLVGHTLMPLLRTAFRSSSELMAAAREYQAAWKQTDEILKSNGGGGGGGGIIEEESKEQEADMVMMKKRLSLAMGGKQQEDVGDAFLILNNGGNGNNNNGGQGSFFDPNGRRNAMSGSLLKKDSFTGQYGTKEGNAYLIQQPGAKFAQEGLSDTTNEDASFLELHREAEEDLAYGMLSSFLEMGKDYHSHLKSSAGEDSNSAEAAKATASQTLAEQIAHIQSLQPVSTAAGEKALVTVLNAFLKLLARPELNFLRDLFIFDVDSYCRASQGRLLNDEPPEAGSVPDQNIFLVRCNSEQQQSLVRLFGLQSFRILHLAVEGALAEGNDRKKLLSNHKRTEKELQLLGGDDNGDAVVNANPLRKTRAKSIKEVIEGGGYPKATTTKNLLRAGSASLGSNSGDNDLIRPVAHDKDEGDDERLTGYDYLFYGKVSRAANSNNAKTGAMNQQQQQHKAPLEISVADPIVSSPSLMPVDPRLVFTIQAVLMQVDNVFDLHAMGEQLPQLPNAELKQAVKQVLNAPVQALRNGAVPTDNRQIVASAVGAKQPLLGNVGRRAPDANPFLLMLKSLGMMTGDNAGLQLTSGYWTQVKDTTSELRKLLLDRGRPQLPLSVASATQVTRAPTSFDVTLAELNGQITRRAAGFHAPSKIAFREIIAGRQPQQQGGPDQAFLSVLRDDVMLLSKVVLLAQMGAEHHSTAARALEIDDEQLVRRKEVSGQPDPEVLRPPRLLLATAQMVYGGPKFSNIFTSNAKDQKKFAENGMFGGGWDKREIKATAVGVNFGSKKAPVLPYASIDAVLIPPPLNPATRSKSLPNDPALAKAADEIKEGRFCASVLSFTSKKQKTSKIVRDRNGVPTNQIVFGRPAGYNHAQTIPEPYDQRRYFLFCTQSKAGENAFIAQATALATTMCAAARGVGLGAQLQLEEFYRTQRLLTENVGQLEAPQGSQVVPSVTRTLSVSSATSWVDVSESPLRGISLQPIVNKLKAVSLPFADPADLAKDAYRLDCNYLLTQRGSAVLPVATAEEEDEGYERLEAEGNDDDEPLGTQGSVGHGRHQSTVVSSTRPGPVPLDLAILDTRVVRGRRSASDKRFVAWASRFSQRLHQNQQQDWIFNGDDMRVWSLPSEDLQALAAKQSLGIDEKVFWAAHAKMTANRPIALSLGPEVPILLECVHKVMDEPNPYSDHQIISDDKKLVLKKSSELSNIYAHVMVDEKSRVVILAFPGLSDFAESKTELFNLVRGKVKGARYTQAHDALRAAMDLYKGFSFVLSGFSYGGVVAIKLSRLYGIRATVFSPALFARSSSTNAAIGTGLYAGVGWGVGHLFGGLMLLGSGLTGNGWLRVVVPRRGAADGMNSVYEAVAIYHRKNPVPGNNLITIIANAGDYACPGYFNPKQAAKGDRGYQLITAPSFLRRHVRGSHLLRQFAVLPIDSASGVRAMPLAGNNDLVFNDFKQQYPNGIGVGDINKQIVTSWLDTYQKMLDALKLKGFQVPTLQLKKAAEAKYEAKMQAIRDEVDRQYGGKESSKQKLAANKPGQGQQQKQSAEEDDDDFEVM